MTNEFSFILKPSKFGIGVFAMHDIKNGDYLRLFGDEKKFEHRIRILDKKNVPEFFQSYCMDRNDKIICPLDFGSMPVGWYLNHSKNPNAAHKNYHFYAIRDIKEGEEILADYNSLEEPEKAKDDYYKS
jgi:SET domain-containing protein